MAIGIQPRLADRIRHFSLLSCFRRRKSPMIVSKRNIIIKLWLNEMLWYGTYTLWKHNSILFLILRKCKGKNLWNIGIVRFCWIIDQSHIHMWNKNIHAKASLSKGSSCALIFPFTTLSQKLSNIYNIMEKISTFSAANKYTMNAYFIVELPIHMILKMLTFFQKKLVKFKKVLFKKGVFWETYVFTCFARRTPQPQIHKITQANST